MDIGFLLYQIRNSFTLRIKKFVDYMFWGGGLSSAALFNLKPLKNLFNMKQFETRIDMLNDAIAYYWGKPERRCVNDIGNCVYYPPTGSQSEGCAIGRFLTPELARKLDNAEDNNSGVIYSNIFQQLPTWMKDLGQNFLKDLQILHDERRFENCDKDYILDFMDRYVNVDKIIFPN